MDAVQKALLQKGAQDVVSLHQQLEHQETTAHSFLLSAVPRGKKFKPLVSEYAHYQQCVVGQNDSSGLESMIKQFPKGAKPLIQSGVKLGSMVAVNLLFITIFKVA